ncbi:MAG: enoyl-CoA hydratase/isomerase family protein [candidate division Zixibacteria bacterium]|nr:enoyl-CoA hydratase/isomerase family protein [candidate division Zixibacteria bacterium]
MSEYQHIKLEKTEKLAFITLNREPLNILNIEMMNELNSALESLGDGSHLKVLVIMAEGKAFSAGVDVSEHTAELVDEMIETFHKIFRLLDKIECPTISLVHGAALGGGCELACFCDMVLAAEGVKLGQPEIKVGVFPPVAAAAFPQYGFLKSVYELLLVGDIIVAEQAQAMGLVNHVFPRDDFDKHCQDFISRLTANSAAILRLTKKTIKAGLNKPFIESLDIAEKIYLKDMMATKDAHEGLNAFMAKRAPVWTDE